MEATPNDANEANLANVLPWLVDMGADEVVLDAPVNRFLEPAAQPEQTAPPQRLRSALAPPQPKPVVNWKAVAAGAEGVAAAEAIAASISSLQAYVDAVDAFEAHPLKKTASRAAALGGSLQASVLILCDKPRNEEDKSGDVLAGNNLQLAEKMLAAIGLSLNVEDAPDKSVALANFIPWRPPGNRAPTIQEAQMLVPLVRKLIELLQPKAILCFGHLAGQYLAGGEDVIMRARGKWLDCFGVPLLPTFHPDTLLKSPASKRLAWHDLLAFREKMDTLP